MTPSFGEALEACLTRIPRGKVATCGTIAVALGDVRAARAVATWLHDHPDVVGAHRVVRADGRPILAGAAEILAQEGAPLRAGRAASSHFAGSVAATPMLRRLRSQQLRLAAAVREDDEASPPRVVAGVDVAYVGERAFAAAACLDAETLEVLEISRCEIAVDFPYIPTYLAFREFPAVRAALKGIRRKPDLVFIDGHGRLHPTLFGFACFAGVELGLPTIGIAKHPLAGKPAPRVERFLGAVPIEIDGVTRGYAWTPPRTSRPFYVSVGHRISLPTALRIAQHVTRQRYPEPLLIADWISKEKEDKKNEERSATGSTAAKRVPGLRREGA